MYSFKGSIYWHIYPSLYFPFPFCCNSYLMLFRGGILCCISYSMTIYLSRDTWFPTTWYVRPPKPQISLRIRAVWSEPLLVAWISVISVKLLTEHNLESLRSKGGCTDSSESTHVKMQHCWKSHVTAHLLYAVADQLSRLGKRELVFLLLFTCIFALSQTWSTLARAHLSPFARCTLGLSRHFY